jgi:hypothetical protein
VDDLDSTRGSLKIFDDGNVEITIDSPQSDLFFKPSKKSIKLYGKIVKKHLKHSTSYSKAIENPKLHAISFEKNKGISLIDGQDKNNNIVMLLYNGGLWFPLDKLLNDICYFGASFSTQTCTL